MKQLLFDCSYTDVWVSPTNWKTITGKAALKKSWYVQCNFFDPNFKEKYPKGFPYRKKLNKFQTLELRKAAAQLYLDEIPKLFEEKSYNPITKQYMLPEQKPAVTSKLNPDLNSTAAIELAWDKILESALKNKAKKNTNPFPDVKQAKNRFVKALKELHFDSIAIKDLKLSEVKDTLSYLNLPDASYNKFLSYMAKIFTELFEYGCVETNPFKLFKKRSIVTKIREVLQEDDFADVMEFLEEHYYEFYRYGMIFHMSGARTTELFLVQKKDVDLKNQEYKVLIKKGDQYVEEVKVIMIDALPFWREVIKECNSEDDYLFSRGLKPGKVAIAARQISIRWRRHVKIKFKTLFNREITADFYALKHLFLDKLDSKQYEINNAPDNLAQTMASHRSPNITNRVYLVHKKKRERDFLKTLKVSS